MHDARKHIMGPRSYKLITRSDLARLAAVARADREEYVARHPERAGLVRRLFCVALCQGAGLHYVDRKNGVKDFDVWTFYRAGGGGKYPPRRLTNKDFGHSKFGKSRGWENYRGRRVDLLGRSIWIPRGAGPVKALREYLRNGRTQSARRLAEKAVIIIEPSRYRGHVVWPIRAGSK